MSAELAAGVIESELGLRPDEVFLEWDPTPIAAASIGQVHRAITHDGSAVAVKVQYPGVDRAVEADLGNVGLLFAGMGQVFPGLEHGPLVAELRERLRDELDYRIEARNQSRFAEHYRGHPFIHVPSVVDHLSTRRVLTTELAEGVGWDEMLGWDQAERDLAAETIYRFAFGSLYRLHVFNGDPHPGNYLFRPGGRVTFLDFGLVKHFEPGDLQGFERMIRSMVLEPNMPAFRAAIEDIGFLSPGTNFSDDEIKEYFGHFYEFVMDDGVYTITPEYASETVRRFFDTSGPYGDIMKAANVPASMVVIQRINLGLYAIFGEMRATANWRRLAEELWPFVDAPPSTPMGEVIESWRLQRATQAIA
jgi:predicted unusual protein kinase regulating ubiquinone biosynthesis (AarF/ABC1/UbiB family)